MIKILSENQRLIEETIGWWWTDPDGIVHRDTVQRRRIIEKRVTKGESDGRDEEA